MLTLTLNKEDLINRTIWFTSDPHYNHFNICRLCNRPFESRQEMNNSLINNWNSVVNDNDIVFILGDFCFDQKTQWVKILKQLKGKKYLIIGNHDKEKNIPYEYFESVCDIMMLYIWSTTSDEEHSIYDKFTLCHYCMTSWPGQWNGFYHLFGHSHTRKNNTSSDITLIDKRPLPSYDVGVDNNNFTPISQENVVNILKQMPLSR
ncbi:metallophosphoesterase [Clostridium sp.]|uniref:metallophosphoesterase n=1 Tax=Clostridium sp. TaxID=1506 RepID=UPI002FCBA5E2